MGFFEKLKSGLTKTRDNIAKSFDNVFGPSEIDDDFYEELEELLIMSDMGVNTTEKILEDLKGKVSFPKMHMILKRERQSSL